MEAFGVDGRELEIVILGVAAGAFWIAAAAFLYVSRHPVEPPVGPRTLELGPEPPALANFLVHDFRVTQEAIAATLIDLAARRHVEVEQRGPGVFYVRLRTGDRPTEPLTRYERRVLEHLESVASGGVAPAEALTTGPREASRSWRRTFEAQVVDDAKARGLSLDAVGGGASLALIALAALPALSAVALRAYSAALLILGAAYLILSWIVAQHPQRETPAGLDAASRWLGVRAELAANEAFRSYTPLTVPLWDRLLAYGAALGVATGASRPLPMGTESDTHAWSSYGGRWRPVRIRYPRLWPPGWGLDPGAALVAGVGSAVVCGLVLYSQGVALLEIAGDGWAGIVPGVGLALVCAGVVVGIAVAVMAVQDQWSAQEVTGPILRLRAFGADDDDKETRYFAAVDDGVSQSLRAYRLQEREYRELRQGQLVTVTVTPNLGRVRWIEPVSEDAGLDSPGDDRAQALSRPGPDRGGA